MSEQQTNDGAAQELALARAAYGTSEERADRAVAARGQSGGARTAGNEAAGSRAR